MAARTILRDMEDTAIFQAEIVPCRSLSPRGLRWVIGGMCAASLGVTVLFWYLGAWPIAGFNGGEMLVAAGLLRYHATRRRAREVLVLSARRFLIARTDERGRVTEREMPAGWMSVTLRERHGRVPRLLLAAHGHQEEVARSLGEPEKRDLADALGRALYQWRHPTFDNPQLRS